MRPRVASHERTFRTRVCNAVDQEDCATPSVRIQPERSTDHGVHAASAWKIENAGLYPQTGPGSPIFLLFGWTGLGFNFPVKPSIRRFKRFVFVALCALTLQLSAGPVGTGPDFKGPLGLQLYSLRGQFTRNVHEGLKLTQGYGFRDVELAGTYNLSSAKFREMLKEHGLRPISGHFSFERYRDDAEGVARDAKVLGLKYAGCAWIAHQREFDEQECRQAIEVFNRAGKVLAKHGIKFFYHCHGYEFRAHAGETFMDLLMRETDPKYVRFEMDVFWVKHPGHDPVYWLQKYPKRWELMHVKDMKKGMKTGDFSGKADVTNDVPIGTGQMDWAAILKAAKKSGVKHYFIEDESPTVVDQIPQSLRYLEQLRF
ncbi:MAG: sugar phosphate isomerase/epimerase [Verrucomicrobia bacterium]|nr:sugar phosphate isomerase/epimerase [Verrucomicrobiota bacterium]